MSEPPVLRPYSTRPDRRLIWWASGLGIVYGLLGRLAFGNHVDRDSLIGSMFGPMTLAFLFAVPFALGFLTIWIAGHEPRWGVWLWITLPWIPAFAAMGAALLLAWEGIICILLWAPLVAIMSSLGGVTAGLWRRRQGRRAPPAVLAGALLLPLVLAPVESRFAGSESVRTVPTSIDIAADAETVWNEIVEVPPIARSEQGTRLVHLIGFPHPVEARTLGRGVGSVRHATFEGGVLFVETVTHYDPGHRLAFSIKADPDSIPQQTLDEHVTVGGPYFDVLEGDYRIEPLAPHRVRLHLASRHRLSTHFNLYAGAWTDFILRDVQENILDVVRKRAEAAHPR